MSDLGDCSVWKDLRWSINLERNFEERSDFIVTVCSKYLIIGRYVLTKDDFRNIPVTKSNYFEITGDIVNGAGFAGTIKILCEKGVAQRPTVPTKYPTLLSDSNAEPAQLYTGGGHSVGGTESRERPTNSAVNMKIVSIAAVDLKSVHIFEANSPQVKVECRDWVGITDVVRSAGIAARWNSLNWKFVVKTTEGVVVTIMSNDVLIGK
eukprot:gene33698-41573_t